MTQLRIEPTSLLLQRQTLYFFVLYASCERNFRTGIHNKSIEATIVEEAELLCKVIRQKNGKPFILEVGGCATGLYVCVPYYVGAL